MTAEKPSTAASNVASTAVTAGGDTWNPSEPVEVEEAAKSLEAILGAASAEKLREIDVSASKSLELVARAAFKNSLPTEFAWFDEREKRAPRTQDIARAFLAASWNQTAWSLEQLHYDQILKQSIVEKAGRNLGHPLFGIAQVAWLLGHESAARHYSALALIGDLVFHPRGFRGAAPHMLANLSDWSVVNVLQKKIANACEDARGSHNPIHPEAVLASTWIGGKRAETIQQLAPATDARPFLQILLDQAETATKDTEKGTCFEAAAALLFSATPGFEVLGSREDVSSQTDTVVLYRGEPFNRAVLPEGYAFVESKYRKDSISAAIVREFGGRCSNRHVNLGILITKTKITGSEDESGLRDAERERHDFLAKGVHILVLTVEDLRGMARNLRGLEWPLRQDLERLRFGKQP
jgi:hypothetical protein